MLIKFNQNLVSLTRNPEVKVGVSFSLRINSYNQLLTNVYLYNNKIAAFNALALNLEYFPTVSRHLADQIAKACVSCFEGNEPGTYSPVVSAAARCLAKTSLVGGKQNAANMWNEKLLCLIGSTHLAANALFDSIDEGKKGIKM